MQLFLYITFKLSCTLKYVFLREEERERDLCLLYVNIKIICYHGNIFFHPLCFKYSFWCRFWRHSHSLCPPFTEPCSPDHFRSGTFDRDFYFFDDCINMNLLTESRRGHFKFLKSLFWQVLTFNVPVSMVVFNFVLFCYFMPTSQRTTLF